MTCAKISKVTISNSNYIHVGLIVISVELVSCPGFSWTLVTPLLRACLMRQYTVLWKDKIPPCDIRNMADVASWQENCRDSMSHSL